MTDQTDLRALLDQVDAWATRARDTTAALAAEREAILAQAKAMRMQSIVKKMLAWPKPDADFAEVAPPDDLAIPPNLKRGD